MWAAACLPSPSNRATRHGRSGWVSALPFEVDHRHIHPAPNRRGVSRLLVLRPLAPRHLLQFECIAVRIGEVCSFHAAPEVLDFADLYTSADKLGTRLDDVLHNQVHASDTAGFEQ